MNVLLLGNGFDLYYKLPTKYSNFLHTANYLTKHLLTDQQTVGTILAQSEIHLADPFIKDCYEEHRDIFDKVPADFKKLSELTDIVRNNKWFSFLLNSFNKDVGWIDFEQEIAFVISCFEHILPSKGTTFSFKHDDEIRYVITTFDFLIDHSSTVGSFAPGTYEIKPEFCIEHPLGSKQFSVSKEKVALFLSNELRSLAKALELYLDCFVHTPFTLLGKERSCKRIPIFKHIEKAVTFNYTNTYEAIYLTENTFHIHGCLGSEIVLGISPDSADSIDSVDTSFINFKKYFQRTLYETDFDYLRWISDIKKRQQTYRLIVMGHSLDTTDSDIILDLFNHANEIIILYHSNTAKASYISKLVELYGKDGFDFLRRERSLTFLCLDDDLNPLAQAMTDEAFKNLIEDISPQVIV